MTTDAHQYGLMQQDLKNVVSMDFHYKHNEMYFADVTAKIIYKAKIGALDNEKEIVIDQVKR